MIDETLLKNCAVDDRKAQSELYSLSYSLAMSIAYRYVNNKNDAELMVNKAMLKVFKSLREFMDCGNHHDGYMPWMSRIMINTLIDDYRSNRKRKELITENPIEEQYNLEMDYSEVEEQIEAEHLQAMLDRLTVPQKNVFNLYAIDGYQHKEIADMLEIPVGTSKWLLSTARKSLSMMLKEFIDRDIKTAIG